MDYLYSMDPERMDLDVVVSLLRGTYWSPRIKREVVARGIAGSIVIGAFEAGSGRQVGFARVVTDRATFAWLCDVIVDESHRGRGISKGMVERLIAHPDLQTLRRWVLATRDAHGLYQRYGFTPVPADRWMEKRLDPAGWQEGE